MDTPVLNVEARETTGKSQAAKLRQQGLIPAVCYGGGKQPLSMALEPASLLRILRGPRGLNSLIKLQGLSEERTVFVQEIQKHPVQRTWLHVDFLYVDPNLPIIRRVPVELQGRPEGVKLGGVLQIARRNIRIESLPANVPDKIAIDVSSLQIGDSIHVEELPLPEGVKAIYDQNFTICAVVAPTAEEEKPAAEGEEAEAAAAEEAGEEAAAGEQKEEEKKDAAKQEAGKEKA